MTRERKTGTKEWAASSVNIQTGCSHGCLYCYANAQAVRFKQRAPGDWTREELLIPPRIGKRKGRIMFPTTHDITPDNVEICALMIKRMLDAGNEVLVVSKPLLAVITRLLDLLGSPTKELTFRFTIGSQHSDVLAFWEPHAPNFADRFMALCLARQEGWQTSVSIEPMLDTAVDQVVALVGLVAPSVTDSIWLGMMNSAKARVRMNGHRERPGMTVALTQLIREPSVVQDLYLALRGHQLVRWKDSIKVMLGIPEENIG